MKVKQCPRNSKNGLKQNLERYYNILKSTNCNSDELPCSLELYFVVFKVLCLQPKADKTNTRGSLLHPQRCYMSPHPAHSSFRCLFACITTGVNEYV